LFADAVLHEGHAALPGVAEARGDGCRFPVVTAWVERVARERAAGELEYAASRLAAYPQHEIGRAVAERLALARVAVLTETAALADDGRA